MIYIHKEMNYGEKQGIIHLERVVKNANTVDEKEVMIAIVNCEGSHPCTYLQFDGIDQISHYDYFDTEEGVHGGYTFLGSLSDIYGLEGLWIGWDYAHSGDYLETGMLSFLSLGGINGHRWTTDELVDEARIAANNILDGKYEICTPYPEES